MFKLSVKVEEEFASSLYRFIYFRLKVKTITSACRKLTFINESSQSAGVEMEILLVPGKFVHDSYFRFPICVGPLCRKEGMARHRKEYLLPR